jgi:hypothetical protein
VVPGAYLSHNWDTAKVPESGRLWSWMIIGYGNDVMAAGQTGNLGVAKLLVEERDRWVGGPEDVLDEADNPAPVAADCHSYNAVWPLWPSSGN